ncbi:diguanylate cyclase [Actinokineospora terrae]|uniref:Diguanylate cyclase, GGDEF domain n=1 Tax=Actinokineospora terrae TaxID=155974 RepID=A0A1H9R4A4_9PSEU|nr:diguanylate cyclase [Actinokineospora terrae]SER67437.1 Diguanylate cyclase, GGDEF domain [Actinokineospora terrae]
MAAWNELPAADAAECAALVAAADRLRWSAPELAVQFADRSLRSGAADAATTTTAQVLLGTGLVRLGRHAEAVEPALAALRAVTSGGLVERAAAVRVALAACARVLGEPLAGSELLRPVLRATTAAPATRALALGQFVACAGHVGRRDDLEDALAEADRLLAADDALSQDARKLERALLCVRAASYHRRHGDTEAATEVAREGLALLNRLSAVGVEGGLAKARLVLEMVCALLDDGDIDEATLVAATVLGEPVRATSALALGRLRLAMASRVYLPSGRAELGRATLVDVVRLADRHGLDSLAADAWTFLAHAEEEAGHPGEALHALRSARAAEYRYLRAASTARGLLVAEVGAVVDPESVVSLLRATVRPTASPEVKTESAETKSVERGGRKSYEDRAQREANRQDGARQEQSRREGARHGAGQGGGTPLGASRRWASLRELASHGSPMPGESSSAGARHEAAPRDGAVVDTAAALDTGAHDAASPGAASRGAAPRSTAASDVAPSSVVLTEDVASSAMPGSAVPGSAMPGGVVQGSAVSGSAVPSGVVPSGVVLSGVVPSGVVPSGVVPSGVVPGSAVSSSVVPSGGAPGGDVPNEAVAHETDAPGHARHEVIEHGVLGHSAVQPVVAELAHEHGVAEGGAVAGRTPSVPGQAGQEESAVVRQGRPAADQGKRSDAAGLGSGSRRASGDKGSKGRSLAAGSSEKAAPDSSSAEVPQDGVLRGAGSRREKRREAEGRKDATPTRQVTPPTRYEAAPVEMFAVTLVRVWPKGTAEPVEPEEPPLPVGGEVTLNALAIHVRDLAPSDAELLRSDRGEFAVLLPSTTLAEAAALAAAIRETAPDAQWLIDDQGHELTISTGVAALPGTVDGPHEGIEALLLAARSALTVPEPASPAPAVLRRTDRLRRSPTTAKTVPLTDKAVRAIRPDRARHDSGVIDDARAPDLSLADDNPTVPATPPAPVIPAPTSPRTAADASTEPEPTEGRWSVDTVRTTDPEEPAADEPAAQAGAIGRRAARRAKADDTPTKSTVDADAGVNSVLSRFGVTVEGGGRRRAPEGDDYYYDPNALVGTDLPTPPMLPSSLEPDPDDPRWAHASVPGTEPREPEQIPQPPKTPDIPEPATPDEIPPADPNPTAPEVEPPPSLTTQAAEVTAPDAAKQAESSGVEPWERVEPSSPAAVIPVARAAEVPGSGQDEPPSGGESGRPRQVGQESGVRAAGQVTVEPAASADERRAIDFAARLRGLPRTTSAATETAKDEDDDQPELVDLPTRRRRTPSGRRERTNPSGLADLLAEALVAFKATQPDQPGDDRNSAWTDDWPKAPTIGEPEQAPEPAAWPPAQPEAPAAVDDEPTGPLPESDRTIGTQVHYSAELRKPRADPAKTHPTGELPRWSRLSTESHWPDQTDWPDPADGTTWAADARAAEPGDRPRSRRADRTPNPTDPRGRHRSSEWAPADFESG